MKAKFVLSALLVLSLACVSSAQLNGNYTIDPSGSGPSNYTTFAAASTALGAGISGPVTFTVASTTFNEALTFSAVTGSSATNTITFIAIGAPAVIQAGATTGMTLNTCKFFIFENLEFNSSGSYCLYSNQSDDNMYKNCKFIGGSQVVYSQGMDRCVFDGCELDGKGTASRLVSPYNANDSDCLFQNCFIHDCGPTGYGAYLNVSGYGVMFWHNTVIVSTSNSAVHLGGCCAWSRANSFRNNIVINMGTGVAIKYGASSAGVLEFNDADYNCYYAPNGFACELENGSAFTKGTLAAWQAYFTANQATLVPAGGGSTWDPNSKEIDPGLTSATAPYDIHLLSTSPCVDAGTTTYIAGTWISYNPLYVVATDFEGETRPATNVDIGADEALGATMLTGSGTGKIGTTVNLFLDAGTGDASLPYQLASSFGAGPIPIDTRLLGLTYDSLLVISVNNLLPTIFQNYSGFLDANGKATAAINIPNIAALDQIRIYTAFVTIKAGEPSGIKTISNTFVFTIIQ